MLKLLLGVLLLGVSAPAVSADLYSEESILQYRRGQQRKACTCYELERRMRGLQTVLSRAQLYGNEERQIRRDLQQARRHYQSVNFNRDNEGEQNRKCSLGNIAVDRNWRQWQPWLARRGWDRDPRCGRRP